MRDFGRTPQTVAAGDPLFAEEQAFLLYASRCLNETKKRRKDLTSSAMDKTTSGHLWKLTEKEKERLNSVDSLVIGRMDEVDGESWHLGRQSLWDENATLVVRHWAMSAAAPFYEATAESPLGAQQRLTLLTDFATLLGVRRELLGEGALAEHEPAIDDMLLAELSRHRTGSMSEVVRTIKRDQYRLMNAPSNRPIVVQGGPGTGKTVVGLHRAGLILYRGREQAGQDLRLLVVGPNPLFMSYIRLVLPQLGESGADQVAVRSLSGIEVKGHEDPLVSNVKARPEMANLVARAVKLRVRSPDDAVSLRIRGEALTIQGDAIASLVSTFDPRQQTYQAGRDGFRNALLRLVQNEYRSTGGGRALNPEDIRTHRDFRRIVDSVWPAVSAEEVIRALLSSHERLEHANVGDVTDVELRILYRRPVDTMKEVQWTPADCALVDEARALIEGAPLAYDHVVLDEAQDLTPMELRMVGRRVRQGAVTILGDLAQATGSWDYDDWQAVGTHLGVADARVEELTYAYRVPAQIMQVALPILEYTAPTTTPPTPYREGPSSPRWLRVPVTHRCATVVREARNAQASGGTTAIIAPRKLIGEIRAELQQSHTGFEDADRDELGTTIELLDATQSKGLEFDHVILVEPPAIVREHPDGRGLRALYVALTRATSSLVCVHSEQLRWPLGGVER